MSEWISVETRLPEPKESGDEEGFSEWVIVWEGSDPMGIAYYDHIEGEWLDSDFLPVIYPTHWMPLPTPPGA